MCYCCYLLSWDFQEMIAEVFEEAVFGLKDVSCIIIISKGETWGRAEKSSKVLIFLLPVIQRLNRLSILGHFYQVPVTGWSGWWWNIIWLQQCSIIFVVGWLPPLLGGLGVLIGVMTVKLTGSNLGAANTGEIGESSHTFTVVRSCVNVVFHCAWLSFKLWKVVVLFCFSVVC